MTRPVPVMGLVRGKVERAVVGEIGKPQSGGDEEEEQSGDPAEPGLARFDGSRLERRQHGRVLPDRRRTPNRRREPCNSRRFHGSRQPTSRLCEDKVSLAQGETEIEGGESERPSRRSWAVTTILVGCSSDGGSQVVGKLGKGFVCQGKRNLLATSGAVARRLVAADGRLAAAVEQDLVVGQDRSASGRGLTPQHRCFLARIDLEQPQRFKEPGRAIGASLGPRPQVANRAVPAQGQLPDTTAYLIGTIGRQGNVPAVAVGEVEGLPACIGTPFSEFFQEQFVEGHRFLLRFLLRGQCRRTTAWWACRRPASGGAQGAPRCIVR